MQEINFDVSLDVGGLSLPRPLVSTQKAVDSLKSGEILKIVTSDQERANNFQTFARHASLTMLASNERNGQFQFFIRKP